MEQRLLHCLNTKNVLAKSVKNNCHAQISQGVVIISPSGCFYYPVFFEIDDGGQANYRNEIDPDDMTDYGYWKRKHPKKSWIPPGYGDDD